MRADIPVQHATHTRRGPLIAERFVGRAPDAHPPARECRRRDRRAVGGRLGHIAGDPEFGRDPARQSRHDVHADLSRRGLMSRSESTGRARQQRRIGRDQSGARRTHGDRIAVTQLPVESTEGARPLLEPRRLTAIPGKVGGERIARDVDEREAGRVVREEPGRPRHFAALVIDADDRVRRVALDRPAEDGTTTDVARAAEDRAARAGRAAAPEGERAESDARPAHLDVEAQAAHSDPGDPARRHRQRGGGATGRAGRARGAQTRAVDHQIGEAPREPFDRVLIGDGREQCRVGCEAATAHEFGVAARLHPRERRGASAHRAHGVDRDDRRCGASEGDPDGRRGAGAHAHTEVHHRPESQRFDHDIVERRIQEAEPKDTVTAGGDAPCGTARTIDDPYFGIGDRAAGAILDHAGEEAMRGALGGEGLRPRKRHEQAERAEAHEGPVQARARHRTTSGDGLDRTEGEHAKDIGVRYEWRRTNPAAWSRPTCAGRL